jgi:Mce-associated membrane protein
MRSRQRSPEAPDADHCDDSGGVTDPDGPHPRSGLGSGAEIPISEAEAADEVAQAEARAEAARERVMQLRQAAEIADAEDNEGADAVEQRETNPSRARLRWLRRPGRPPWLRRPGRPRWLRRPGRKAVAVGVGIVLASTSLAASGYMIWQHHTLVHKRQLTQEYAAAARQAVTTLMSIDPNHAREDVQRMIDAATGDLKSQLSVMSALMVKQAEDSKVGGKVTVEAVAVESVSDNSGVVLVAAKSDATGPDNAKKPPALWRLSVNINRDGGQLKMSKIDFLK